MDLSRKWIDSNWKWIDSNWKCIDPQEVFLTSGAVLEGISCSALDFWCFVGVCETDFRSFFNENCSNLNENLIAHIS